MSAVTFRNRADGTLNRLTLRHLFLFIGADPNAEWLAGCVETNDKGFVVTGMGARPLETNPAYSRSATCAPVRRSASPPLSAKVPRWLPRSMQ